ncbi:hypothetical protein GWJ05_07950 [Proteus sp. G2626]|uniref:hypothetical protein n=1 Tax=Proteus sp. G2626 TaxID=2698842 RepID=UPI001376D9CB|nr:hypothetical protein [Proteus sp. G2626]NBN45723.1 hypothetical protein [Proteus sp. G2626]
MSDNTIQLKVSVDTTELDRLEEQLTRIKQLVQDVGINISIKPKQSNDLFIAGLSGCFIKDAVIDSPKIKFSASGDAVFSGVLAIGEVEQDINAQLADLRMRADRQDANINELMQAREIERHAWAKLMNELNNRTWCSQK